MFSVLLDNQNKSNYTSTFWLWYFSPSNKIEPFTFNNIQFFWTIEEIKYTSGTAVDFLRVNNLMARTESLPTNNTIFRFFVNKKFAWLKWRKCLISLVFWDNNSRTCTFGVKLYWIKESSSVVLWELPYQQRNLYWTTFKWFFDFNQDFDFLYLEISKIQNDYLFFGNYSDGTWQTTYNSSINHILTIY